MKVYVIHDDPMEEETTIYGVFKDKHHAIIKCKELCKIEGWPDPRNYEDKYQIKQVELT